MAAFVLKALIAFFFFMVATMLRVAVAARLYKVGDSVGWSTMGKPDYKKWAASKNFHVGDTIVFEYNPKYHNVVQVNQRDYISCNVTTPLAAAFTTGYDSFTITKPGHYYFLCGVPDQCEVGLKVDIRALVVDSTPPASASVSAPAPAPASPARNDKLSLLDYLGLSIIVGFIALVYKLFG